MARTKALALPKGTTKAIKNIGAVGLVGIGSFNVIRALKKETRDELRTAGINPWVFLLGSGLMIFFGITLLTSKN